MRTRLSGSCAGAGTSGFAGDAAPPRAQSGPLCAVDPAAGVLAVHAHAGLIHLVPLAPDGTAARSVSHHSSSAHSNALSSSSASVSASASAGLGASAVGRVRGVDVRIEELQILSLAFVARPAGLLPLLAVLFQDELARRFVRT